MSVTSAMFTGVSGLLNNGEAMNVIGNNLSNVNTIGFKYGRTLFSDMLSANIGNNSQVGRGMQMQKVENMFSQGSFENTENTTDLAIQGNSFFALGNPAGNVQVANQSSAYLTRAGAFHVDNNRYLVNPDGYQVLDTQGNPIQFNDNATAISTAATAYATSVTAATTPTSTLANDAAIDTAITDAKTAADAALVAANDALTAANGMPTGTAAERTAQAAAVAAANASVTAATDAVNAAVTARDNLTSLKAASTNLATASAAVTANPNADSAANANSANAAVSTAIAQLETSINGLAGMLNNAGSSLTTVAGTLPAAAATAATTAGTAATTAGTAANTAATAAAAVVAPAKTAVSSATTAYSPVASEAGLAFAKVVKIEPNGLITYLGKDGTTQMYYNTNSTVGVGTTAANAVSVQRVAVVNVNDPTALEKAGGTLFKATVASGVPSVGFSLGSNTANAATEKILSNSLEMSNVDMASQFVKMITTQRAYSANSKTITTSDEMIQEALQLKR